MHHYLLNTLLVVSSSVDVGLVLVGYSSDLLSLALVCIVTLAQGNIKLLNFQVIVAR